MSASVDNPTVFCLAGLGLGAASFGPLREALGDRAEAVPVDLPGFGDRPVSDGTTVAAMADVVAQAIRAHRPGRWLLLGHSMGGKVATVVAQRALAGTASVFGLAGIALLAPSSPSPEPMPDAQRAQLLGWATDGPLDDTAARAFVDDNTAAPLPGPLDRTVLALVRAADPRAWTAWLEHGSREDWSDTVGVLDLPALILAGADDGPLGPAAQRDSTLPHFARGELEVLDGAAHFLHLERPQAVADAVMRLWDTHAGLGPAVPRDVVTVLAGERVAALTRGALARRALADDPGRRPQALTDDQLATLRAVADRVVPQDGPCLDLAARVDAALAAGEGDGWRPADLPPDREAYAQGLDALQGFAAADAEEQDALLTALAAGNADGHGLLDSAQLAAWFEDVRDDLVRRWVMHPATLARIGYDGYAIGGDADPQTGFLQIGLGRSEAWEPATVVGS